MSAKREWVVGFLLDTDADSVVLIRKNRPAWQAGKLNGVGGKVEPGESLLAAMRREFVEETGVSVRAWHHFATLTWEEGLVHFFRAFEAMAVLELCRTVTDESVERHRVHTLSAPGPGRDCVTPNLLWLVPLAAHRHDTYDVIDVVETGTTLRKPGRLDVLAGSPLDDPPAVRATDHREPFPAGITYCPTCGHRLKLNNEVTGETYCPVGAGEELAVEPRNCAWCGGAPGTPSCGSRSHWGGSSPGVHWEASP